MLQLDRDGAELFPSMYRPSEIADLQCAIGADGTGAGIRIFGNLSLHEWLQHGPIASSVRGRLGEGAQPVRAILFDKSRRSNWTLGWHQDRTIAVKRRVEQPGFEHWTVKSGSVHVEPPFHIIENMLTARIHIDAVSADNAPLLIAPGSHLCGRIMEDRIQSVIDRCGTAPSFATPGDVWLYRTAILHASERSRTSVSRRVLQVDFSADRLPGGMEWLGIA